MRLLWDENIFGVIGAFCVAGLALAMTWVFLEGLLQLPGPFAGLVAVAAAVATLEGISRRHYEQRRPPVLQRVPVAPRATRRDAATMARRSDERIARRRAA